MGPIRTFLTDLLGLAQRSPGYALRNMIFTDGLIDNYMIASDALVMQFTDYTDDPVQLRFTGGIDVVEQGSINEHIDGYRLETNGDRRKLSILNDEGNVALSITFEKCDISFL